MEAVGGHECRAGHARICYMCEVSGSRLQLEGIVPHKEKINIDIYYIS